MQSSGVCKLCASEIEEFGWRTVYDREQQLGQIPINLRLARVYEQVGEPAKALHRLQAIPPTASESAADLYAVKGPNYLADLIVPGHETWASLGYVNHKLYFGMTPTQDYILADDHAVSLWMVRGRGSDGEELNYQGCDIYRLQGDKIIDKNTFWKIVEHKERL